MKLPRTKTDLNLPLTCVEVSVSSSQREQFRQAVADQKLLRKFGGHHAGIGAAGPEIGQIAERICN